jgi:hypothetical protein
MLVLYYQVWEGIHEHTFSQTHDPTALAMQELGAASLLKPLSAVGTGAATDLHTSALQASSYQAGEVVQSLRDAILGPGQPSKLTFSNEKEVLAFLGNRIINPIWKDPVCGDNKCEWPWEFPAYGPFGCRADCGMNPNVTSVVVAVSADFTNHQSLSPRMLMNYVSWNVCLNDTHRRARGQPDLCW